MQARTIIDLKNMISKQQQFIEDNDVGQSNNNANIELFLEGADLDLEVENEDFEDKYNSDQNNEEHKSNPIETPGELNTKNQTDKKQGL